MNFFSAHNRPANQTKPYWLLALSLSLMLVTQAAHADFRKALEAYQKRDGDTLLKEVKDAVEKKNDDGLMLFLMATNMDAATSDYDETTKQSKSTLRAILPPPKWDALRDLLTQATNNSSVDAQYYLNVKNRQFSREFMIQQLQAEQIKRGEKPKAEYTNQETNQAYENAKKMYLDKGLIPYGDNSSVSSITKQADAGDPEYQAALGFFNLGFPGDYAYACEKKNPDLLPLCEMKVDKVKGYEWLKKAVKGYEQDGLLSEGYGKFASNMCNFLKQKNPTQKGLRQAYLWCFMGANLGSGFSEDWLGEMYRAGQLKTVAPQLDSAWDTTKRNEVLYVNNIKEWPDMVLEARQGLTPENTPVFSYLYFGRPGSYAIEVYADGRVFIKEMQMPGYKTLFTNVSPKKVKQFLAELHLTGLETWTAPLYGMGGGSCYSPDTKDSYVRLTLKEKNQVRYRILTSTGCIYLNRLAKVKSLVDSYFPTKQLRIELGNSEKILQEVRGIESLLIKSLKREN